MFGTKTVQVWENVLDDLSMTLTQGHGCGANQEKLACLQNTVRTAYPITSKLGAYITPIMLIT